MKFTKLRVVGFKSFVEPTEFIIERGLTGVVGPNGCGKSNLVESLRWVMGENSYKNMRASGMDDVIFSGSGNRPARNSAEVGLFLDNSDRTAPAAFNDSDEIQVTRRIERENGSVYRINGKEARAKDVQLLFADASTGARSPSMVGQGRIGELIQAKPQARRQLLEEAAGISGLHSRRHEAELRLRAAETNLERLEDIVAQLESQIESLKRQARQANRFKMLSADIRARDAMLLHIRWTEAKLAEAEAETALNEATSLVAERAQAQMEAAKAQAIASLKLPELRDNEVKAAASVQRLQIARTQLEEDAGRLFKRRDELTRRLTQLDEDIRREERLVADNAQILDRLAAEETELEEVLAESGREAEDLRIAFEETSESLSATEKRFAAVTAERAEAAAGRNQLERALRDLAEKRLRLDRQADDANRELAAVAEKLSALPDPEEKREAVEAGEFAVEEAESSVMDAEERLSDARRAESMARGPVDAARSRLAALETEAKTIAKMLSTSATAGEFSPVADELTVERGFETAVGAALGDDLESPLDARAPAHWAMPGPHADDAALPQDISPLSAYVQAPDALLRRLKQIGVTDAQTAARLMPDLKPGQRLVTKEGAVYRWDGHITGSEAPSAAALRLAQKNRLTELETEAEEARFALDEAQEGLNAARDAITQAEGALSERRERQRLVLRQLAEARDALSAAERASGDLLRRRAVVEEAVNGLRAQIEEADGLAEEAQIALADQADLTALDGQLQQLQMEVATSRGMVAEARARFEGFARENDQRQRRIIVIRQERQSWQDRAKSAGEHIATLKDREAEARDEMMDLDAAPDEFDEKRRLLINELEKADAARRAAADLLAEAETMQREADQLAATALSSLAESRERRGRAEERLLSARERRKDGELRIQEALNVTPQEAFRLTGLKPEDAIPDLREVERELDRLKMERERLGAVNLRADEEQKELSDKLAALIKERDDIIDAIKKLRGAIQSLNREGRERLVAAFDVVNAQFQRLFTHLFNGGTAELQPLAQKQPLTNLQRQGLAKVLDGTTSIQELARVLKASDNGRRTAAASA